MARSRSAIAVAVVTALPMALGGCAGALVVGGLAAAGGAGYAAGQERGVNGVANDFTIKTDIEKAFIDRDPRLQIGVTTTVYQGRVLLTGRVPGPRLKQEAADIAGRVRGVRTVYNEVRIAGKEGLWDDTRDAWITTQLRSKMVMDPAIRSVNYTIDTENGSVYLIGSARSQAELDRVTRLARYVPGVRRVVSYVTIRAGEPVAGLPPPAAGAPPVGEAAPLAPIEVQKL